MWERADGEERKLGKKQNGDYVLLELWQQRDGDGNVTASEWHEVPTVILT